MLKTLTALIFMLLLCSCEIFGWDSAGGNNGDEFDNTNGDEESGTIDLYYIDVPIAYPKNGSAIPTETASGSQISLDNLDEGTRSTMISMSDALKLTMAACDETATSITNLTFDSMSTNIGWINSSAETGSLTLSNDEIGTPPLQVITCID